MATKPTQQQIDSLADRRMRDSGVMPPVFSEFSNEAERKNRSAAFNEKRDRYRQDAELFLNRVAAAEQVKEDAAAARDKAALEVQVDRLRAAFLDQPGTTEVDFQQALPRLLERQREAAPLAGATQREAAKQTARASGRYVI